MRNPWHDGSSDVSRVQPHENVGSRAPTEADPDRAIAVFGGRATLTTAITPTTAAIGASTVARGIRQRDVDAEHEAGEAEVSATIYEMPGVGDSRMPAIVVSTPVLPLPRSRPLRSERNGRASVTF